MIETKIILFILLAAFALLPILFNVKKIYKSRYIKMFAIILLLGIMIVNVKISILENNELEMKNNLSKNLQSKIDVQLNQLENLLAENYELKSKLLDQKDILKLSAELDNYVTDFVVYIIFDKTYNFEEVNPASFGYDFYLLEKDLAFTEVFITDDNLKSNNGLMLSYKIYDVKRDGNSVGGSLHGSFTRFVNGLQSKILIVPNTYTIREIHNGRFSIVISPNLIDKVVGVIFTVNNWILIDQSVDSTKWEKLDDITRLGGWQSYRLDQKTFYRIKPEYSFHNPTNPWIVDLFGKPLHKFK